ncbi:hypothetical protein FGIG_00645 [Fasciola gigantica]|uniref:C2 domain-containing protein n=1 Tax=Fasciola gigantica TaxID=46835 RepID=A0A504Y5E4_FASGI|nr:hypothetical protein FGIG_00645 [Fasciola gigantica]
MPLIQKANMIASTSIGQLRKKAFSKGEKSGVKHKDRHRDTRSSYQSEWDLSCEGKSATVDRRTLTRASGTILTGAAKACSGSQAHQSGLSVSTGNLAEYNAGVQYSLNDDRSDADVNSSVYDSNSLEDSGAILSSSLRLVRQVEMDEYDDTALSSVSSKKTFDDRSDSIGSPVQCSRSRLPKQTHTVPKIQIESHSDQSDSGQRPKPPSWNANLPNQSDGLSSICSPSNRYPSDSSLSKLEKDSVLPREGFFWQILLYLRLARGLPVRTVSGRIDAYVKVKYRGKTFLRTPIISNNRNPVWDEKFFIPINNLNYPMELRVYHRDAFKKDDYIGRAMVYPSTLTFGLDREFTVQLHDETGRSVPSYSGELNFWMTLNETPEMQIPSDRRRSMLKQIKEDRLAADRVAPMIVRAPSDASLGSYAMRRQLLRRQWSESTNHLSRDFSIDIPSDYGITSMDEYEPDFDEWLLPDAASFHQPQWPLLFYEGTKVGLYTSYVMDKTQYMSIAKLAAGRSGRNEVRLENLYNRARLLVNLIRAEELGFPNSPPQPSDDSPRSPVSKSKILASRGMERAVMGRPINHADGSIPSYIATLWIGKSSRKSRPVSSTTSPFWHQHFEFRLKLGEKAVLNVEITDHAVAVPMMLFRGHLDFKRQVPDWTGCFTLKNNLDGLRGHVILLVTLTGLTPQTESPNGNSGIPNQDVPRPSMDTLYEVTPTPSTGLSFPTKDLLSMVQSHYSLRRTWENRKDVGWLHLVVHCARDLAAKDRNGKSDPYCVIRLVNRCVHTSTVYKTVNPVWNQSFVFPISDIYDVLEIVVQDEDKRGSDFLGKLSFPVVQIANRRCKWYTLKDKKLRKRTKGVLLLESYIEYNSIRAAMRVVYPKETPWVYATSRVHLRDLIRKYVPDLQHKIDRITPYGAFMANGHRVFMKLYNWENKILSSLFLVGMWLGILFVQPYMIVGGMMFGFAACCLFTMDWFKGRTRPRPSIQSSVESEEDDYEDYLNTEDLLDEDSESDPDDLELKQKRSRKKPLKAKLAKAREVLGTLQSVMESVASMIEKIDCLLKWQVPWLSMLFFLFLILVTLLTYFIPPRYLLIIYATKRFTRRLRNANVYDASPMSIISRAPNKLQRLSYRELKPKLTHNTTI